ncbi:MAG: carboxypeptidase-like regulatory domain-containing protein [Acidobacteriaceae bacterium]
MGILNGTVSDPSGARIEHAAVRVESSNLQRELHTDGAGRFSLRLPSGTYQMTIEAPGFRSYRTNIRITEREAQASISVRLKIATKPEEITVPSEDNSSTAAGDNKSALVFKGDQLKEFSDDDSTFQREILAMAGGAGSRQPEIFVNGFSNGRFPPKSTIREIRINRNPYSAE